MTHKRAETKTGAPSRYEGKPMDTEHELADLRRKLEEAERMIAKLKMAIIQAIDMAGTFERHMEIRAVLLVALAGCVP